MSLLTLSHPYWNVANLFIIKVEHEPNIDPNFRAGVEDNSRHPANETYGYYTHNQDTSRLSINIRAEGLSTSQPLRGYQASGELGQLEYAASLRERISTQAHHNFCTDLTAVRPQEETWLTMDGTRYERF